MFWLPARHNEKTQDLLKKTQDQYAEKEVKFKEDSQKRLEERLKVYDQRILDLTAASHASPTKAAVKASDAEAEQNASIEGNSVAAAKKDENNEEEQGDNIDEQYGEDDLINEIYNMNWNIHNHLILLRIKE